MHTVQRVLRRSDRGRSVEFLSPWGTEPFLGLMCWRGTLSTSHMPLSPSLPGPELLPSAGEGSALPGPVRSIRGQALSGHSSSVLFWLKAQWRCRGLGDPWGLP